MQVRINGEATGVDDGMTVAALVEQLALEPKRIAIERNKDLLPRAQYAETHLVDGDELEIVTLVGGG